MSKLLVDPGDAGAPIGSEPWCVALRHDALRQKKDQQFAVSRLKFTLRALFDDGRYRLLTDREGRSFETWEDFVQYAEPEGLGMRVEVADAVMSEADESKLLGVVAAEALRKQAEKARQQAETINPKGGRPRKEKTPDGVRGLSEGYGNNSDYLLRRIARTSPGVLAAYEAGKYRSVREAARDAGIGDEPKRISVGSGPEAFFRALLAYDAEFARAVYEEARTHFGAPSDQEAPADNG